MGAGADCMRNQAEFERGDGLAAELQRWQPAPKQRKTKSRDECTSSRRGEQSQKTKKMKRAARLDECMSSSR